MGPTWGRQDPGGPHVSPMILVIWDLSIHMDNMPIHQICFIRHITMVQCHMSVEVMEVHQTGSYLVKCGPCIIDRSRVTYICVSKLGHIWFRQWLVARLDTSHYLNQWWFIVSHIPGNKLQWKLNQNRKLLVQGNAFENIACIWWSLCIVSVLVVGLRPANERRHYKVTPSLIVWAQT